MSNPLLIISGATATGKTDVAVALAKKYPAELISTDSCQIYQGLDIGTGKDHPEGTPLHLIDLLTPDQKFSVAQFQKLAQEKIKQLHLQKKLPILVGCSGFYLDSLINNKVKVKDSYFSPISGFFLSMMIGLFGKQYGLLATYSNRITELNFLVNCYILSAFFGITGKKSYRLAGASSGFDYNEIEKDLDTYDFSDIENFIKSLSNFGVMSGIDKYSFLNRTYRVTGLSFIPALEDLSRFISIMVCVSMKGSNIINTFISKYNEDSFARIIEISKLIFKK